MTIFAWIFLISLFTIVVIAGCFNVYYDSKITYIMNCYDTLRENKKKELGVDVLSQEELNKIDDRVSRTIKNYRVY